MPTRVPQLLRDNMPARPETGEQVLVVSRPIKAALLVAKLHSEVEEIARDLTDPVEYADVLETLFALGVMNGVEFPDIIQAMNQKRAEKGALVEGKFWVPKEFVE